MARSRANDPLAAVEAALGRRPPEELARLDAAELDHLAGLIADAHRQQLRALQDALYAALKIVPRPLRPVLRKVLS